MSLEEMEAPKAPATTPMKDRHPILGWIIRLYMTLTTAFMAWVGAENLLAGSLLVLLGAALDVVRYCTVPEVRMSEEELADRMERAFQNEFLRKYHERRQGYYTLTLFPLAFGYTLALIAADAWLAEATLRAYLELFGWLHEIGATAVANARRHPAELAARGYEFRALLVVHAYSINVMFGLVLTYVASTYWWVDGNYGAPAAGRPEFDDRAYKKKRRKFLLLGIIFPLSVVSGGYAWMTNWQSIDWAPRATRHPWYVHVSDMPLAEYAFVVLGQAMFHWLLLRGLAYLKVRPIWRSKYILTDSSVEGRLGPNPSSTRSAP